MISVFDEVIQGLSQEPNLLRIKKLLIYACQRTWENDPAQIEAYELRSLVQKITQLAPTLEKLRKYLTNLVKTLTKSAEYTLIANALVTHLQKLYPEFSAVKAIAPQQAYLSVAQQLERHPEQVRIKKLVYAACKQTWENDLNNILQLPFSCLIQDLHQLTATPSQLEAVLNSIVQTLNRPTEYALIAQAIATACAPLYGEAEQTQVVVAVRPPAPPAPKVAAALPPQTTAPTPTFAARKLDLTNLFDLRLELMKYTNPLRSKILLFSILYYPLTSAGDAWMLLKGHELDNLLREFLQRYSTLPIVQEKLQTATKLLPEPDQYAQVTGALLRALKPFCEADGRLALVGGVEESIAAARQKATHIPRDSASMTAIHGAVAAPQGEHTGQVKSSAVNEPESADENTVPMMSTEQQ